ncbi:hypothetical protein DIPPA_14637 [Diplonema papillatum]|nr:hypothetical protein DIPPA_14637 [Diplonema papillatum]
MAPSERSDDHPARQPKDNAWAKPYGYSTVNLRSQTPTSMVASPLSRSYHSVFMRSEPDAPGSPPMSPATALNPSSAQLQQLLAVFDRLAAFWHKTANSPRRAYLGYILAVVGTMCGGVVFPLMDLEEGYPSPLKVVVRGFILTFGFGLYWWKSVGKGIAAQAWRRSGGGLENAGELWLLCKDALGESIPALRDGSTPVGSVLFFLCVSGATHGAASLLAQLALASTGDEVTAVLTNCSCAFAAAFTRMSFFWGAAPDPWLSTEKYGISAVLALVLYLVAVVQPPLLGALDGVSVSFVNALHYTSQRRLKRAIPFVALMTLVYLLSTLSLLVACFYLYPELRSPWIWLSYVFDLRTTFLAVVVAFFTAVFQGSMTAALEYCSPVIVTGALSLEPLATFAFDWVFSRPLPNWHAMCILLLLMFATSIISLGGAIEQTHKRQSASSHSL